MPHRIVSFGVCLALLLAIVGPVFAADPKPLGEAEFLERFRKNDPRFEILGARVEESRADVTQAGLLPNPSLAYDREEVFHAGDGLADNFVRLAWPVDVSGRRSRRMAAAEKGAAAAQAEAALDALFLLLDARGTYYDGAHARLRAQTLIDGRNELATLVNVVRSRKSAGDASGYDLDRLELELGAYDDLIVDAESDLDAARRRLGALVGEPGALYDASDPLDLPPAPRSPEALMAGAVLKRGDFLGATLRADQAAYELAAARRSWVPGLVLTGGLKTSDTGDGTAVGYVAGVAIDVPLFDHGQGAQARSEARRREWQASARAIERQATTAIAIAQGELVRRVEQAKRYEQRQVSRLRDLLRRAEAAYREGDRPIFELLDAYRTARDVRLRHLEIGLDAKKAEIALSRALGQK